MWRTCRAIASDFTSGAFTGQRIPGDFTDDGMSTEAILLRVCVWSENSEIGKEQSFETQILYPLIEEAVQCFSVSSYEHTREAVKASAVETFLPRCMWASSRAMISPGEMVWLSLPPCGA